MTVTKPYHFHIIYSINDWLDLIPTLLFILTRAVHFDFKKLLSTWLYKLTTVSPGINIEET